MKTKIAKIIIIAGTLLLTYSSCNEDFLERSPKGTVFTEGLQTARGVDALLIGAYRQLGGAGTKPGWPSEAYSASILNWTFNVASDNAHRGTTLGDQESIGRIERLVHSADNEHIHNKWMVLYDAISRTNDVLRALEAARERMTENEAKVIEGQAKFLRGFYHFRMQKMHYQIPYITEDVEAGEVPNDKKVWDDIERDLQFAIDNLPESFPGEAGRATKWAAMAVKGHVHLFQQEWQDAASLFDAIIDSEEFELMKNFYYNFDGTHQNNAESIFEVQYAVNNNVQQGKNGNADHWVVNPHGTSPLPTCCGMYQPSQDLVNAFETDENGLPLLGIDGPKYNDTNLSHDMGITAGEEFIPTDKPLDPRLDWTVGRRGIPYLDWGIFTGSDWIRDQTHGGPYEMKKTMYYQSEADQYAENTFTRASGINWRLYRLGHVMLWRAECAVELNDLEKACDLVNEIRRRAGNQLVMGKVHTTIFDGREIEVDWDEPAANYKIGEYPSFPNQEYAREAVHMEIRLESALEGYRFFDLVRWGKAEEVINEFLENDSKLRVFTQGVTFLPKHNYFPLPQSQIDIQHGILVQDPAW